MKTRRFMLQTFACALIGSALPAAQAGSPLAADPVADSFRRMLDHQPTQNAPAAPASLEADPLRGAISVVLWSTQSPSYHWPASYARIATQTKPGH